MAYIMGFIAADGTLPINRNIIKIGLNPKDVDILEQIKAIVEIESNIHYYTTAKGYNVCSLEWTSLRHRDTLRNYHITPQKTQTLAPPTILKECYYKDYIRGYFDGDGSIGTAAGKDTQFRYRIAAHKDATVLEWIAQVFSTQAGVLLKEPLKCQGNMKEIAYTTTQAKQIFQFQYYPGCICLKRKLDRFIELIDCN